ncbi:hypothetical protein MIR68_003381 [Amoeboaphelidium protococcarum]|nr:hypothetical protein MIR68_003381 [Amoeboaphelidium protococcarum]KAI3654206.1 hypothetical protein MP228_000925 [Amoeboaphelidium protococcarum]
MATISENRKEIEAAYQDVRDDKTPTTFVILEYVEGKEQLKVAQKGSGDWKEVVSHLKEDQAQFAFVRYVYSNDPMSHRAKFVFVAWCGPQVKVMRKAKLTVQIADVKTVFKNFAVEVQTGDLEDLEEGKVLKLIKKAGGASYDGQAS